MKPQNETQRLEALNSYKILDTLPEEEFDRLTELASLICGVPITLVSLIDAERQWFKSKVGLEADETPRDISFCQFAILGTETFTVEDASQDERFKENPLVTGAPDIRFYAGQPLIDPNGYSLGTLCIIDKVPRKLDSTQQKSLQVLAKEVVSQLVARKEKLEKQQYESLFNMSVDIICVATTDGLLKTVNPSFLKVLGWDYDELSGKPFANYIHPDDLEATFAVVAELAQGAKLVNFVNRYRTSSGDYKSINWCCNPDVKTGELYAIGRDVTEVLATQKILIETQKRLTEAQKISQIGSWEVDLITHEQLWSSEHYRIFEIDEPQSQENLYKLYRSRIHPDDIDELDNNIKNAIELGNDFTYEHRCVLDNGTRIKHVIGIGKVNVNEHGKPYLIKGTIQDITDRKQAELKVKHIEGRWKFAIEGNGDGLWDWDLTTNKLFYSDQWKKMIGYEPHEISDTLEEWSTRIHPDDIAEAYHLIELHLKKEIPLYIHEQRIKCKDGSYIWALDRGQVIEWDNDGKPTRMIGTNHDLTTRKQYENTILDNQKSLNDAQALSKIGNWQYDFINQRIVWSDELYNIFEIDKATPAEDLFGLYAARYIPEELQILETLVRRAIETGESYDIEHKAVFDGGKRVKYIFGKGEAVKDENGQVKYLVGIAQDITERKLIEEQLRINEERWAYAIDATGDGIWDWTPHNKQTIYSNRWAEIIGYELNELSEADEEWSSRLHPDDIVMVFAEIGDNLSGKTESFAHEYRFKHRNGNYIWILNRGKVVERNSAGEAIRVIGTHTDITQAKYTEQIIVNREKWIRSLVSNMDDLVFVLDQNFIFKEYFQKASEGLYLTPEMFVGKHFEDVGLPIEAAQTLKQTLDLCHESKLSQKAEYFLALPHTTLWFDLGVSIVRDSNDEIVDYICVARDITDAKNAELEIVKSKNAAEAATLRLSLATQAANIGIWEYNIVENDLLWDDQMFALYGLRRDSFKGAYESWRSGLHPDDAEHGDKESGLAIKGEKDFNTEFRVVWPDGTVRYIRALATVVRDNDGNPLRMIGTNWDITDAKNTEREIIHAKNAAEAASVAKSDFLANMSHEIRTPLNGVIGFTDLLLSTELDSTQQLYVSTVNNSAKSLLDIINDILDFSKIEAGKLELEIIKTELETVLIEASNIVSYQCQSKKLEFLLNIAPNIPQFIWTDGVRLRQILVNILSNAIKFTNNGEIELKIEVLSQSINESTIRFSVRDTGVGIASDKLQTIFKAFSQEDNSTTRKFGGTGLGLTISNKLLEMMNSTPLQVESTVGVGSVFYFDVYYQSQNKSMTDAIKIDNINSLLIITDNLNLKTITSQILEKKSIAITTAADGIEALYILKKNQEFDVLLIDLDLPDMEGLEVIKKIRKNSNPAIINLPIIIMYTPNQDTSINATCAQYGVKQQLQKPITTSSLINALINLKDEIVEEITTPIDGETFKSLKSKKILIVDDNAVNLFLAKTILANLLPDAEIVQASDGIEAVELYKSIKPDIVFMDIQMPKLNGYEAAKEIRIFENETRIPIIALTAGTVLGERDRCLSAGMDDYIAKPFVKESIAKVLNDWLK